MVNKINKKIVCLGGGIGTVNLITGLKKYVPNITIAVSMADEGGSAGRLRRLYHIFPPGDVVSCMAAIGSRKSPLISQMLTYRFPGDRYGKDADLAGHKLGSLILVAMRDVTGDFNKAIGLFQKTFNISGRFLPATQEPVRISIRTKSGEEIFGEETIDLGKYDWKAGIETVTLHPQSAKASTELLTQLSKADAIIAGPGDLYTTIMPVLIIPQIRDVLKKTKAKKIFVVNVANKPYETRDYTVTNYLEAIKKHLDFFPFDTVIVNSSFKVKIPKGYDYTYVSPDGVLPRKLMLGQKVDIIASDLVDEKFPLYHTPLKLAKVIIQHI